MVQVIVGAANPECGPLLEEMFRHRYQIFIVEKGWDLKCENGLEIDTYDTPDTIYLVEFAKPGEIGASMRINATHDACMLSDLFADMCEREIPRGPDIWECTRGALSPDLRRSGIYGRVMCAMFEAALLWGAKKGLGLVTVDYLMRQMRFGLDARPLGPPRVIDGEPHVATEVIFNTKSLARLRTSFRIGAPVIERLFLSLRRARRRDMAQIRFASVQTFSEACMKATRPDQIAAPLGRLIGQLGLTSWYVGSLVHECELHRGFGFYDGAREWSAHYTANRHCEVDPIFRHACSSGAPIRWSDCARSLGHDPSHKPALRVLHEASDFGIKDGFTKSFQCFGDMPGIATFGGLEPDLSKQARMSLLLIGAFAYEGFRRVVQGFKPVPATLTPRQADVLRWSAEGKTAWEIGQILAIAERTVRCYMDQLKAKYNVPTMMQVVVRALLDGNLKVDPVKSP